MGIVGIFIALLTLGYIVGVWTACGVFRQPQRAFEDGAPADLGRPSAQEIPEIVWVMERPR